MRASGQKAATRIRNAIDYHTGTKIGSVLMPVVGVPAEAVRQTVAESSPFGILDKTERDALRGKMGAVEQERAQVKMVAGTALIGMGIWLSQKGLSTLHLRPSIIIRNRNAVMQGNNPEAYALVIGWRVWGMFRSQEHLSRWVPILRT